MEIKEINIYNKDTLIKDFLIGKIGKAVHSAISENTNEHFILKGGTALRKFFIPNYPRFTGDLDYKINTIESLDNQFIKNLEEYIYIYMNQSLDDGYKSININPLHITKKGIGQFGIRFNKVLGRFDYTIGMDFSPKLQNEKIESEFRLMIPSKIDEIVGYNDNVEIEVENINHSIGNKTFALLSRIGNGDAVGSTLSRFKDLFDIWYCTNNNMLDINKVKRSFFERLSRESGLENKIVKNQIYQTIDSEKYFQNLIKMLMQFDTAGDEKTMFYKYVRGLDKNYIIPNIKNIYDTFRDLLIYIENNKS